MKIYRLVNDEGLIYIGKTTSKNLLKRLAVHKSQANTARNINKCSSKKLFENDSNVKIELLEEIISNDKEELRKLELKYILETDCVNIMKSGLEYKETKQNWYNKNPNYNKNYYHTRNTWVKKEFKCDCGSVVKNCSKGNHLKSKKHKNYLDSIYNGSNISPEV